MIKLTAKEEEIMNLFWAKEHLFVREILEFYDDPKPHFNTISTTVRTLEDKGFLSHKSYGSTYQYSVAISKNQFKYKSLKNIINKYYNNSVFTAVSSLVEDEEITIAQLKELIDIIEKKK